MTDKDNKMKSAFKFDCMRIGCSAHYLNKLLQHVFTNNNIKCDAAEVLFSLVRAFIITNIHQCQHAVVYAEISQETSPLL